MINSELLKEAIADAKAVRVTAYANARASLQERFDKRFEAVFAEKLKNEARAKAIADAKKKADELKGQIGIKLGKIINFYENIGGYPLPYYAKAEGLGGGVGGGGPSVPAGENEITVNVTITYQIK